jgi:hypothetical protein
MHTSVRHRRRQWLRDVPGGCECAGHAAPGGSTGCPAFVPASLVTGLQRNRAAVDVVVSVLQGIGLSLTQTVVLASLGIPVGALGTLLSLLVSGCDAAETLKQQARAAAIGAKVAAIVATIGTVVSLAGIISAPAAVPLGAIAALCTALVPVLEALGAGRAPKASDVTSALSGMAELARIDGSALNGVGRSIDDALRGLTSNPALREGASSLNSLARSLPDWAKSNPAVTAAANTSALSAFAGASLTSPAGYPWSGIPVPAGTDGKFAQAKLKFLKAFKAAGSPTSRDGVAAVWRAMSSPLLPAADLERLTGGPSLVRASTASSPAKAPAPAKRVVGLSTAGKVAGALGVAGVVGVGIYVATRKKKKGRA